jgi:diacylglycerol kinase (ATP)
MTNKNFHVIMNPASGGGKTGKLRKFILNKIKNYLGSDYKLWITEKSADAVEHTVKAIAEGGNLIIAVGGDGTVHEVVNGICLASVNANTDCTLGIISSGTGQDFVQGLGINGDIDYQLSIIKEGIVELIDIGVVKYKDDRGRNVSKYFANEFQAGLGGKVAQKVNSKVKNKGGFLTYGLATIPFLFRYKGSDIKVKINDEDSLKEKIIGIIAANGNCMGGGMKLTKTGSPADHYFDLFIFHKQNIINRLLNFSKVYFGKLKNSKLITIRKADKLMIDSGEEVQIEADGEFLGKLPCEISLLPSFLKVLVNPNTFNKAK